MAQNFSNRGRNVIELVNYRARRDIPTAGPGHRACRHCGAPLMDGETDDDCSALELAARPLISCVD